MIPLQASVPVRQIAFKNLHLELKHEHRRTNHSQSQQFLESVHYSILHRGRVLLSGVEGEASAGEVAKLEKNIFLFILFFRFLRS